MARKKPRRQISPERKGLYYGGMAMMVVGVLLFFSVIVSGIAGFGSFADFEQRARDGGMLAVLGMALMIVGGILSRIGARGLAGSGALLDPERAREDIEPWSRMAGGAVDDALDEVDALDDLAKRRDPAQVVKVRCPACKSLNDESDRFCGQCGVKIA